LGLHNLLDVSINNYHDHIQVQVVDLQQSSHKERYCKTARILLHLLVNYSQ